MTASSPSTVSARQRRWSGAALSLCRFRGSRRLRRRAADYPVLPQAALGDKLALNGTATLGFVQAVIPVAELLIREVDDWIQGKI